MKHGPALLNSQTTTTRAVCCLHCNLGPGKQKEAAPAAPLRASAASRTPGPSCRFLQHAGPLIEVKPSARHASTQGDTSSPTVSLQVHLAAAVPVKSRRVTAGLGSLLHCASCISCPTTACPSIMISGTAAAGVQTSRARPAATSTRALWGAERRRMPVRAESGGGSGGSDGLQANSAVCRRKIGYVHVADSRQVRRRRWRAPHKLGLQRGAPQRAGTRRRCCSRAVIVLQCSGATQKPYMSRQLAGAGRRRPSPPLRRSAPNPSPKALLCPVAVSSSCPQAVTAQFRTT